MRLTFLVKTTFFIKKITVLTVGIFLGISLFSQPSDHQIAEIDSLKNIYLSHKNDTNRLKALTLVGQRLRFVNIDSSKYYLRKAIALHREKKVSIGSLSFAYNVIGNIYTLEPNVDSARYYYEAAYQFMAKEKEVRPYLAIIAPYGNFLANNNEVERGIRLFQEGIDLAKEKKEYASLSFLYEYLGEVFQTILKDNKRAEAYYQKGLVASEHFKTTDPYNYKRINTKLSLSLSGIYLSENKTELAIDYAKQAAEYGAEVKMNQLVIEAYNNLCQGYIALNQYQKAKAYNVQAQALSQKIQNIHAEIQSEVLKQEISLKTKNYENCIQEGQHILAQFSQYLKNEEKGKIFEQLCECHAYAGNTQASIQMKDSILYYIEKTSNVKRNELIGRLDREYQVKEKEAENKILQTKQDASLKQLKTQRIAALGLGVAFLFAIGWGVAAYRGKLKEERLNDVLEQKVAQRTEELQNSNDNLEQANYELRTFNFIASHDIKEPIRNIGNFVGLIQTTLPNHLKEELDFHFTSIKKSTSQLYTLIEDFTKYTSLSKNGKAIPLEEVELAEIVDGLSNVLTVMGKYQNAKVISHGLPAIFSNKSTCYVILKNLIENGLKYNTSEIPQVTIVYQDTPTYHLIKVQDNGIGIQQEYFKQIFEMFKRLHGKHLYAGSGIGLALVALLVKKLNGKIDIESKIEEGSVFKVYLPKVEKPTQV